MSASLVAAAERQGSALLHLLSCAADDGDVTEDDRRQINAAANHVSCALNRLARIQTPARESPNRLLGTAARGPVQPPARTGEARAPGSVAAVAAAAGESDRAVVAAIAGAPNPPSGSEGGCAGGGGPTAPGAVGEFSLPRPPRFSMRERENRLIGEVEFTSGTAMLAARLT